EVYVKFGFHNHGGEGLCILSESVTSPTLAWQRGAFLKKFPKAKWHQYKPVGRDQVRAGARLAFGEEVHCYYRLDRAKVILSVDADFLCDSPGCLRYTHDF